MKIRLTPSISYVIGLWSKRRTHEGIGIRGMGTIKEVFIRSVLENGLTTPEKLLIKEKKVFFYHSAYRKFFQDVLEDLLERFKYVNEYSANYLAGIYDGVGVVDENGFIVIEKASTLDEIVLLRLGFNPKRRRRGVVIGKPLEFLRFIYFFVKIKKNEVEELISKYGVKHRIKKEG